MQASRTLRTSPSRRTRSVSPSPMETTVARCASTGEPSHSGTDHTSSRTSP